MEPGLPWGPALHPHGSCCRDTFRPACLHLSDEPLLLLASVKCQTENAASFRGGAEEANLYAREQEGSPQAATGIGAAAPTGGASKFPRDGGTVHAAREMLSAG